MRPTWDEWFITQARTIATRGTCARLRVGAVLVRDNCAFATGYNGAPHGFAHCDDVGHMMSDGHCIRSVHAEQNAIVQAARHGVTTVGATVYVTHYPCVLCAKLLIQACVVRVVCGSGYKTDTAAWFFAEAGIEVTEVGK